MNNDISDRTPPSVGNPLIASQRLAPTLAKSFSTRSESCASIAELSVSALVGHCQREIQAYRRGEPADEAYGIELLCRALVQDDQDAWTGIQHCLGEFVRGWLYIHPLRASALRWESEENYVALAFERFWHASVQQQLVFKTLAGALAYLRASLNGAILDTLRAYARPAKVPLPEPGTPGEPFSEDLPTNLDLWEILERVLLGERERQLAYLLYCCNLKPREIMRFCPQEWSDVREIYRLRRNILERLRRNADQLRWRFNPQNE